jgi:hypothetical protein
MRCPRPHTRRRALQCPVRLRPPSAPSGSSMMCSGTAHGTWQCHCPGATASGNGTATVALAVPLSDWHCRRDWQWQPHCHWQCQWHWRSGALPLLAVWQCQWHCQWTWHCQWQAAAVCPPPLGPKHPDTLCSMNNSALLLHPPPFAAGQAYTILYNTSGKRAQHCALFMKSFAVKVHCLRPGFTRTRGSSAPGSLAQCPRRARAHFGTLPGARAWRRAGAPRQSHRRPTRGGAR